MFEQTFLGRGSKSRRPFTLAVSSIGQIVLLMLLVVAPMVFSDTLPPVLLTALLQAPMVPPPPPARVQNTAPPTKLEPRPADLNKLMEPVNIPAEVARIIEEAPPPVTDVGAGIPGGIGVPGGLPDGVVGSILTSANRLHPPPPPKPRVVKPRKPPVPRQVRAGGEVRPPVLIRRVAPVYPSIARQAGISGVVALEAVIGIDGHVKNVRLVSGHPFLIRAAMGAVRQWIYRPTLLNGEPVEVLLKVEIRFLLGR